MKLLTFLHRWLGVLLGLFFTMWFLSGMGMMYVPFPSLPEDVRMSYMPTIDTQAMNISPDVAVASCGLNEITGLRVISINDSIGALS